jgi:hypothetical protein
VQSGAFPKEKLPTGLDHRAEQKTEKLENVLLPQPTGWAEARVLKFASLKVMLPWSGEVVKPDRATSGALVRRAPAERRLPGDCVLAADRAIQSEPYSA